MQQTTSLYDFIIIWRPFLLRVGIPEAGIEKPSEYKTLSKESNLYKAGQSVGIEFTAKCPLFPNTIKAHAFLEFAASLDDTGVIQNEAAELLFKAYFTDGQYPDMNLLTELAIIMNFDQEKFVQYMNDEQNIDKVSQAALQWRQKVRTGVPFFIINGQEVFSGAQEADVFVKTFSTIAAKYPLPSNL